MNPENGSNKLSLSDAQNLNKPTTRVRVAVETPQHSGLAWPLDYLCEQALTPGTLVRVPLGKREVAGLVWPADSLPSMSEVTTPERLRCVAQVLEALPPLGQTWLDLLQFAAAYYQRGVGELALAVLPPQLRELDAVQLASRMSRLHKALAKPLPEVAMQELPALSIAQEQVLAQLQAAHRAPKPFLLNGVTGSGKTEIYLRSAQRALDAGQQALVLVPEINLTPQLEERFNARFVGRRIVSLHSGLTPALRLRNWLIAHLGLADLVLGTRLAVFASLPRLGLIVVDEEHDPSYKQQDGARYSARDLAVWRGHQEGIPVILGSATPSLESWQRCLETRYQRLDLAERIGGGTMPRVRLVDMTTLSKAQTAASAISPPLLDALKARHERGEQSLVFLNRRGYAPVLHCSACAWKSACPHCSAWRVFHKLDRTLRCHHCGLSERVPRACPDCGNLDIAPLGRGTERLEEQLAQLMPGARVARIDADSTRHKGELEAQLAAVHAGDVDVLVGTQMVTKGHDFRRITLVAAVNPDGALFSSDFRAPERLFALLMQASGRAGRDARQAEQSEMWVQTWHPNHALYQALRRHDYGSFAAAQLEERRTASLPPFSYLALLRAEARDVPAAQAFLAAAAELATVLDAAQKVQIFAPVPLVVARVANVERQQMLMESASRLVLQRLLLSMLPQLNELKRQHKAVLRWAIDVDPLNI